MNQPASMAPPPSTPQWSELPRELLCLIVDRLPQSSGDRGRLSAVRSRDVAAAVDRAADGVVEAAGLLARILGSTIRLLRAVLATIRTLAAGCRVIAGLLVLIGEALLEFRVLFSPASLQRHRQQYRDDEHRMAEREIRRWEQELELLDREAILQGISGVSCDTRMSTQSREESEQES